LQADRTNREAATVAVVTTVAAVMATAVIAVGSLVATIDAHERILP